MAKLLYITAHPLDELVSNSMAAGKAFIESYQDNHSDDEVKHIDLFTEDIPYIDKDVLTGKTFKYTAEGPQGLLTDKKVLHIQSRGGYYSEGPTAEVESGDRYLRNIMTFLGVPSYETVIIEGHNAEPEKAEEIKLAGVEEAKNLGKTF